MMFLRAFGFLVLAVMGILITLAAFGITSPDVFTDVPLWLRVSLLVGACVYLVCWLVADFQVIRAWFRSPK